MSARLWLDDVKEWTGLSSNDIWREPEDLVAWRNRVNQFPNGLNSQWHSRKYLETIMGRIIVLFFFNVSLFAFHDTICTESKFTTVDAGIVKPNDMQVLRIISVKKPVGAYVAIISKYVPF